MSVRIVPVSFADACAFVADWHRHHEPPRGHKFSIGVADGSRLVGVAIVGRPVARRFDDGRTLEVNRTATDGTPNVNSMLYAAAWRAAKAARIRPAHHIHPIRRVRRIVARCRLAHPCRAASPSGLGRALAAARDEERKRSALSVGGSVMSGKHERRGLLAWLGKRAGGRVDRVVAEALEHQIECTLCDETAMVQSDTDELLWLHAHLDKHPGYQMWETGPLAFYENPSADEEAAIARAKVVTR